MLGENLINQSVYSAPRAIRYSIEQARDCFFGNYGRCIFNNVILSGMKMTEYGSTWWTHRSKWGSLIAAWLGFSP